MAHAHFISSLETGEAFETDGRDNRKTLAVVLAGYESAERQAVIHLDTEDTACEDHDTDRSTPGTR